jgi:hypothetical protein
MTNDLQPQTYEMVFIFAGMIWMGLITIAIALWAGFSAILSRIPKPDTRRWEKEWDEIEKNLSK